MSKLWIKFKTYSAVKVSIEDCQDVNDFLKACKKELSPHFDSFATDQLSLSTTADGPLFDLVFCSQLFPLNRAI